MATEARSKFGAPMFELEVFRKQMYCIEVLATLLGLFRRPRQGFDARGIMLPLPPSLRRWVYALNADAHLSAALLCYFRRNWCRNLAVVNCILHWIILTLSSLQMGITLVIVVA